MLHEAIHVMGFSNDDVANFVDANGIKLTDNNFLFNDGSKLFMRSPKLIAVAKTYFGCDSITMIPLENDGDAGSKNSHFEAT